MRNVICQVEDQHKDSGCEGSGYCQLRTENRLTLSLLCMSAFRHDLYSGIFGVPRLQVVRGRAGNLQDLVQLVIAQDIANGGKLQPAFNLEPTERLVRLEAAQSEVLHGLRLRTSTGRESPWYGNPNRGIVQVFEGSAENPIIGVECGPGNICTRIATAVRFDGSAVEPADDQGRTRTNGAVADSVMPSTGREFPILYHPFCSCEFCRCLSCCGSRWSRCVSALVTSSTLSSSSRRMVKLITAAIHLMAASSSPPSCWSRGSVLFESRPHRVRRSTGCGW